ncbi:aquaporin [Mycoplasmopsis ciconiae]|uniref:Aquaporin n=1 Tax=Mycoplasmopsis ciconiae TaxID=561067 RepID=A0ABU7MKL3_9BACT|nr:aquaporin [Mycoplasmopsis ciconiae]
MDNQKMEVKHSVFEFFKYKKEDRKYAQEPNAKKYWYIHALSEIIGTVFLCLGLAGLSIYVKGQQIEHLFLIHNVIVGFFAGFIIVGLCLFIFLRYSCDLNPAVTLLRWMNGTNTTKYALMKIAMQIVGLVLAVGIIYGIGSATTNANDLVNNPIQALKSTEKLFENFQPISHNAKLVTGGFLIFFIELVMTAILLFPIFSPNINNKYRDLMILFIISMSVWMGILGGTAAINPVRGLAQQLPTLVFQNNLLANKQILESVIIGTVAMVLGDTLAPVFYLFVQGITQKYVNPFIVNTIKFKNNRNEHMRDFSDEQ